MLSGLLELDKSFFLFLNGLNSPFWDQVMWLISGKTTWIPLYLAMIFLMFKKFQWRGVLILVFAILSVTLADQVSVKAFKDVFQRLRPCHCEELEGLVHIVRNKCGGKYGFVSSHAANTFAIAVFTLSLFKLKWYSLSILFWAAIVGYSRIYLGVHYPLDVICGALLGTLIAFLCLYLLNVAEGFLVKK